MRVSAIRTSPWDEPALNTGYRGRSSTGLAFRLPVGRVYGEPATSNRNVSILGYQPSRKLPKLHPGTLSLDSLGYRECLSQGQAEHHTFVC